jgi:hypothetical protein
MFLTASYWSHFRILLHKTKLRGLTPRAIYSDRATGACRRSQYQLLRLEGATWSAWRIPTAYFRLPRPDPLLSLPSSSFVGLTRLCGPRSIHFRIVSLSVETLDALNLKIIFIFGGVCLLSLSLSLPSSLFYGFCFVLFFFENTRGGKRPIPVQKLTLLDVYSLI